MPPTELCPSNQKIEEEFRVGLDAGGLSICPIIEKNTNKVIPPQQQQQQPENKVQNIVVKEMNNSKIKNVQKVEIDALSRLKYYICCHKEKIESLEDIKIRKYELMIECENVIEKKSDIIRLFKLMDEFRLLKKLILNKNQCIMLEHRRVQNINTINTSKKEIMDLATIKQTMEKKKLNNYIKELIDKDSLSPIDKILLKYVDNKFLEKDQIFYKNKVLDQHEMV